MVYVFAFKENNSDDRDCVKYIEIGRMFECGHYFTGIGLHGACFSHGFELSEVPDDITTILTNEEFKQLSDFNIVISRIGYNITKNDDRYKKGMELYQSIQHIFDKLQSDENEQLFEKVQEEEKQYIKEEYDLTDEDIVDIWDNYGLYYRDRGIISYVFSDYEELGREEAFNFGIFTKENERLEQFFDYEKYGEALLENEEYLELSSGKIARYNY